MTKDWPRYLIRARLLEKGWTLASLSEHHDYNRQAASRALANQWPAVERIIADAMDVDPWAIWPSRYDSNHEPVRHSTSDELERVAESRRSRGRAAR